MKNLTRGASIGLANAMMLGITATAGILLTSASARAANLSFTGSFTDPNETRSASFSLTAPATVTIQSSSWAAGGFDPVLTLFDATNGNYIQEQDDISANPPNLDFQLIQALPVGNYQAVLSVVGNYANGANPGGNFSDGFTNSGDFFSRTKTYDFEILNVSAPTAVPEPSSLIGTVVAGLTISRLKRRLSSAKKTNLNIKD